MLSTTRKSISGAIGVLALAILPAAAPATSVRDGDGDAYAGAITGELTGDAVLELTGPMITQPAPGGSWGTITCDDGLLGGQIANAGGPGSAATGSLTNFDARDAPDDQACPDTLDWHGFDGHPNHEDLVAQELPWSAQFDWLNDGTSGQPNATLTLSGVVIFMQSSSDNCTYWGDLGNSAVPTKQVRADVFNPDNSSSGQMEVRFVDEPLHIPPPPPTPEGGVPPPPDPCPKTADLTATYLVSGEEGAELEVRELRTMTVAIAGTGSGTVTATTGIECPADCVEDYLYGSEVTLTANPDPGSSFSGWSGDCAGTGGCGLTMDDARDVTATFTQSAADPGSVPGSVNPQGPRGSRKCKSKKPRRGAKAPKRKCKRKKKKK